MSAIATQPEANGNVPATTKKKGDVRSMLESESFQKAMAQVLPTHITPDRFVRVAIAATTRTPKLLQCTPQSLLNAMMTLSQFGIEPDGRRAHLIPYENRRAGIVECQLIIDYKGLVELAMRSGMVRRIHADAVCENDEFEYDVGRVVKHRVNFRQPRGKAYAYYAMVEFKDGSDKAEVMPLEDILAIRDGSQGWQAFKKGYAKQSPWQSHEGEMCKKTVFRRLTKWMVLSPEFRDAVAREDEMDGEEVVSEKAIALLPHMSIADALSDPPASDEREEDPAPPAAPAPVQASPAPDESPAPKAEAVPEDEWPDEQVGTVEAFTELFVNLAVSMEIPRADAQLLAQSLPAKGYDVKSARKAKAMSEARRALRALKGGGLKA